MRSADCAHEVDDRHHHESRRDHRHAQGDSATAHCGYDATASSDQHQQERAPSLGEHASPLQRGIEKVER